MALKLRTEKAQVCVEYWEGAEAGIMKEGNDILAKFYGCPMTPSETNRLLEDHKKSVWDSPGKKQAKQRFETYDDIGFKHSILRRVIEKWEGVEDEKGNPLDCTDENKITAWEMNPDILNWILEQFEEVRKRIQDEKEVERKNLKASRGGKAKQEPLAKTAE